MYGNKMMEELRQNQKADVVLEHIVQGMLYSAVLACISTVRTEGPRPQQEVGENWQPA